MADFTHLHTLSHFTLLESTITVASLVARVKELGMDAVALTDRSGLFGAYEFQTVATKAGIKPIIGCQLNIAPLGIGEKTRDMQQLVLLAANTTGYRNLVQLVSLGWQEGFYYEPRVDLDLLRQFREGLICLTGAGPDGFLNRHLQVGAVEEAQRQAGILKDIFDERLYIEVADLGDGPGGLRDLALQLARDCDLPPVATNWVHYLRTEDAPAHDVLLAIQKVTTLNDIRRKRMSSDAYYLKDGQEMAALFAACPEALANTRRIVEACDNAVIPTGTYHLPVFQPPDGQSVITYLRQLCEAGLVRRYQDDPGPAYHQRLDFELEVIEQSGFAAYFLIVADFIGWAKEQGIPVGPGRGSAAGSLVAYVLGIIDICPIKYGLLFERFLNPGRKSMPDIDIDLCKDGRQQVIDYVARKYGTDAVAQIMTLGTMKARMAIKDVARAYAWTPEEAQDLANLVPEDPSGKHTISVCLGKKALKDSEFDANEKMVERYQQDERTHQCLDTAIQIENLGRSLGVHACGVIITPGPVNQFVPVCNVKGKTATQYSWSQIEDCGLLKMDFLGLKTLSILKKAADLAQAYDGVNIDYSQLPLDDQKTFSLLGEGDTLGVFQCESTGFQELIKRLKPDRFEDMIALVALYRPGPLSANMHTSYCDRKHGLEQVDYPHPVLKDILEETYGLYIYQEQVMNISRELCGFTPAEADDLRKAMGKKLIEVLNKLEEKFIEGAWEHHQFPKDKCKAMWENILGFASYGFNKSHSACYGLIAYRTAYMKANHFGAFMTANLIYEMGNKDKMTQFVLEMRERGVPVLPPDVNESGWEFTFNGEHVRFGFGGIKGVGQGAAEMFISERDAHGPFSSLFDFCERIDTRRVNKRVVENLIKTGAFDNLHPNRNALLLAVEKAFKRGARLSRNREQAQTSLFDAFEQDTSFRESTQGYPAVADWPEHERLAYERALTGYWMSSHPLREYQSLLRPHASHTSRDLLKRPADTVCIAAVIIGKRLIKTRTGKMMAVLQLEDEFGKFEGILYSGGRKVRGLEEQGAFERFADHCDEDTVGLFRGHLNKRDRQRPAPLPVVALAEDDDEVVVPAEMEDAHEELPAVILSEVIPIRVLHERLTREIIIGIDSKVHTADQLKALATLVRENAGNCPLRLQVHDGDGVLLTLATDHRWHVHPHTGFIHGVMELFGEDYVQPVFRKANEAMAGAR